MLLAPISGAESAVAITRLAQASTGVDPDVLPGGLLSPWLYFTNGSIVQRVTDLDEDGSLRVLADGYFLDAING